MKTVPIEIEERDLETGELLKISEKRASLMPPPADACQECGRKHAPEEPHDALSLYYQYSFYGEHGRWPTWKDALAHCSDAMKRVWEIELRMRGAWSEPTGEKG